MKCIKQQISSRSDGTSATETERTSVLEIVFRLSSSKQGEIATFWVFNLKITSKTISDHLTDGNHRSPTSLWIIFRPTRQTENPPEKIENSANARVQHVRKCQGTECSPNVEACWMQNSRQAFTIAARTMKIFRKWKPFVCGERDTRWVILIYLFNSNFQLFYLWLLPSIGCHLHYVFLPRVRRRVVAMNNLGRRKVTSCILCTWCH